MDYRHEVKHVITAGDAAAIRTNMSAVAHLDPHSKEKGYYRIRSLYFDDPMDTALREKLDGVNERRKFRIRYYNDDLSYIMLECKIKRDGVGCKPQERLTLEETQKILRGETDWMVKSGRPLLAALYVDMKTRRLAPKTVVEYKRVPFVYGPGNVRVTIDWAIRTGPPKEVLDPNGLTLPIEDDIMLLEVKWDDFLPSIIRDAVQTPGRRVTAFSKYAQCRMYD